MFFAAAIVSVVSSTISFSSEEKSALCIPINNGLLTKIPGNISVADARGYFQMRRAIVDTYVKNDLLVHLLKYYTSDGSKGGGKIELFCPIVIEETMESYGNHEQSHGDNEQLQGIVRVIPVSSRSESEPFIKNARQQKLAFSYLEPKGQLQADKNVYREVKEAIRQNKVIYCSIGQGAFIYNVHKQPDIRFCELAKEQIEQWQQPYKQDVQYFGMKL